MEGARRATQACDVLFLDPDNGLAPRSVPITSARAPKHAYLDELSELVGRGQSAVIYHHLARNGTHAQQISRWSERLMQRFKPADLFALRFGRGTARAFFVLAAAGHASLLRARAEKLVASSWRRHFTLAI